jgi:ABC-type Fe3+/spermidine/putrescine transport system ATPase subunit
MALNTRTDRPRAMPPGPALRCTDLRVRYPGQDFYALGSASVGVSFSVNHGELFALLGPSGCGKTTTLRIIGGFLDPTTGTIEIECVDVTRRQPYERPTNTVFQSYALFPHMRVEGNVAYGLKMEWAPRAERARRVREALELVGLAGMEKRRIAELSGGQQQRVALARALVKRPAVLLLDEPLGALDLKVRRQMQDELVRIKQSTGATLIHVTHDQEEACAIADRIAVMKDGMIVQVDTPEALYRAPRDCYVASFIDAGTIVRGRSIRDGGSVEVSHPDMEFKGRLPPYLNAAQSIAAVLPRNRIKVSLAKGASDRRNAVRGTVERLIFTGSVFNMHVRVSERLEVRAALTIEEVATLGEENLRPESVVELHWRAEDIVFVEDSEIAGAPRPPHKDSR